MYKRITKTGGFGPPGTSDAREVVEMIKKGKYAKPVYDAFIRLLRISAPWRRAGRLVTPHLTGGIAHDEYVQTRRKRWLQPRHSPGRRVEMEALRRRVARPYRQEEPKEYTGIPVFRLQKVTQKLREHNKPLYSRESGLFLTTIRYRFTGQPTPLGDVGTGCPPGCTRAGRQPRRQRCISLSRLSTPITKRAWIPESFIGIFAEGQELRKEIQGVLVRNHKEALPAARRF